MTKGAVWNYFVYFGQTLFLWGVGLVTTWQSNQKMWLSIHHFGIDSNYHMCPIQGLKTKSWIGRSQIFQGWDIFFCRGITAISIDWLKTFPVIFGRLSEWQIVSVVFIWPDRATISSLHWCRICHAHFQVCGYEIGSSLICSLFSISLFGFLSKSSGRKVEEIRSSLMDMPLLEKKSAFSVVWAKFKAQGRSIPPSTGC